MTEDFFNVQTPSSFIKANIVAEYFPQYCRIILKKPQEQIMYMDLFSGPGMYKDGKHSTPLLIANACANDMLLKDKVLLAFNDNEYSEELKDNFNRFYPKETFYFQPRFGNKTVGEDSAIHDYLVRPAQKTNNRPTLLFFDPWGYKGIDTLVLAKFLENWGNEIFLFVNIKRIHAAIENDKFDDLMKSLFPTTIDSIRHDRKYKSSVYERLNLIMDNLASEFTKSVRGKVYHCAFKFQEEDSVATSHFIIHLTKHAKGYELVKQIYYDFDNIGATLEKDGVYTFDSKNMGNSGIAFGDMNVLALSQELEKEYKGRTIVAQNLFQEHQKKSKYCGSHYAKTLRFMLEKGKIFAKFTDDKTHKVSVLINENCILKFK
jgi:three-Cys-motif partner protein